MTTSIYNKANNLKLGEKVPGTDTCYTLAFPDGPAGHISGEGYPGSRWRVTLTDRTRVMFGLPRNDLLAHDVFIVEERGTLPRGDGLPRWENGPPSEYAMGRLRTFLVEAALTDEFGADALAAARAADEDDWQDEHYHPEAEV